MAYQSIALKNVRFSYCNILEAREDLSGRKRYSAVLLLDKSDIATKGKLDIVINQVIKEAKAGKWGGKPATNPSPVQDGDGTRQSGTPFGEECKGHWVINAKASEAYPPRVFNEKGVPESDPEAIYSGMYGHAYVSFYPYDHKGNRGVAVGLEVVQKTKDGDRLDGRSQADPASLFGTEPADEGGSFYDFE